MLPTVQLAPVAQAKQPTLCSSLQCGLCSAFPCRFKKNGAVSSTLGSGIRMEEEPLSQLADKLRTGYIDKKELLDYLAVIQAYKRAGKDVQEQEAAIKYVLCLQRTTTVYQLYTGGN